MEICTGCWDLQVTFAGCNMKNVLYLCTCNLLLPAYRNWLSNKSAVLFCISYIHMCFHFYYGMTYILYILLFQPPKKKKVNRVKWTSKEFEEIEKYLGHKIREKKNPTCKML